MKILVAVKRVIDPYVKIRVQADEQGVETKQVKMAMNPFDEIAVEEALRLREKSIATEIVLVSIANEASQETLKHGLALGADRAILLHTDEAFSSLNVAKLLQQIVVEEAPHLVFMGKQAIDGDNNQTPQMLAALLNWPQATFASKLIINGNEIEVTREIDGGLETLAMPLPAVVSTDLRLNEPRYASLPNIMKAKQKPLTVREVSDLPVKLGEHTQRISVKAPAARSKGVILDSVEELLTRLKQEAKVLS
ncbi:MAG: electron transfer flavoprotein subunit beta/FixA family protein [Legionella sp.]|nr:electron transfer flavoprotein subunit beta/FixA family protein [Legionella sp.]